MPNPSVVLATAGYDHTVRFWEATRGICYRTLQYADSQVNKLEITPDKQYLAAAGNPHIRLFEVHTSNPQPVTSYDGHSGNVTAVGFEREGRWMYSGSDDGTLKIWDLRSGGYQREYESRGAVTTCALHPNGTELISGDQNGNIRVWDLTANACSCELVPEVGVAIRSVTIAGDGSLVVAANSNGTCYVWKLQRGAKTTTHFEPLHKLQAHNAYVLKCLLSPDCRLLATTSSDKTVKLWNLDGFKLERTLEGHQRWVWDCVFSVDAAYLVTASSDTSARLWDCASGAAIQDLQRTSQGGRVLRAERFRGGRVKRRRRRVGGGGGARGGTRRHARIFWRGTLSCARTRRAGELAALFHARHTFCTLR